MVNGAHDRTQVTPPTEPVEPQPAVIDVWSRLQVVERPTKILGSQNDFVPVGVWPPRGRSLRPPLIRILVNGEHQRPSALDENLCRQHFGGFDGRPNECGAMRKVDDRL